MIKSHNAHLSIYYHNKSKDRERKAKKRPKIEIFFMIEISITQY